MQFLKIQFWCMLAFVAALFTYGNWTSVPIRLWGGMIAETNLPALLLFTFLVGFLPTFLYQHAVRWRLRQRLTTAERTIGELRVAAMAPATIEPAAPPPVNTSAAPPLVT